MLTARRLVFLALLLAPAVARAADSVKQESPIITAKGTQGASAKATQDLKDAGRSQILLVWERVAGTANVESTLANFTIGNKAAAAITPATSYTVTSGKTLRIQSVHVALTSTSTVVNNARVRIRQAASGITNGSPIIFDADVPWPIGGTVAANLGTSIAIPIPDGLEVAATHRRGHVHRHRGHRGVRVLIYALAIAAGVGLAGAGSALLARARMRSRHARTVEQHVEAAIATHEAHVLERAAGKHPPFDEHLARIAIRQRAAHALKLGGHKVPDDLHAHVVRARGKR